MKILSVNTGSSSLKFAFYDFRKRLILMSGSFERIGMEGSNYRIKYGQNAYGTPADLPDHAEAIRILLALLRKRGFAASEQDIDGVGHRIVQGADKFKNSILITPEVFRELEKLQELAPLHNPPAIMGIQAFQEVLPNTPMVAVFDTAFHQTMPAESYLYPVPLQWYRDYSVRKYGFHGINHQYVTRIIHYLRKTPQFTLISCHIGNGASISAIRDMECIDTSMGFTPLAGLMMGSRSGDIDPSIIPYIMEMEHKSADEVVRELNQNSGLLGISEQSSDMRDILELCKQGDSRAILVKKMFVRRVVNYIAQYYVLLGGADVIAFTGGIGENSVEIREEICEQLRCLGVELSPERNANAPRGLFVKITTKESPVAGYIIPAQEELMIGFETLTTLDPSQDITLDLKEGTDEIPREHALAVVETF